MRFFLGKQGGGGAPICSAPTHSVFSLLRGYPLSANVQAVIETLRCPSLARKLLDLLGGDTTTLKSQTYKVNRNASIAWTSGQLDLDLGILAVCGHGYLLGLHYLSTHNFI